MSDRARTTARQGREASVRALVAALEAIVASRFEGVVPGELLEAMGSQGALARYNNADLGLVAMSLNTQKAIADQCCGGYQKLDALRVGALAALQTRAAKEKQPSKGTKEGLKLDNDALEQRISVLEQDLGQLTWAFGRLAAYARSQAQEIDDPRAVARFAKELRSIESGLSLLSKPLGTNVVLGDFGG